LIGVVKFYKWPVVRWVWTLVAEVNPLRAFGHDSLLSEYRYAVGRCSDDAGNGGADIPGPGDVRVLTPHTLHSRMTTRARNVSAKFAGETGGRPAEWHLLRIRMQETMQEGRALTSKLYRACVGR